MLPRIIHTGRRKIKKHYTLCARVRNAQPTCGELLRLVQVEGQTSGVFGGFCPNAFAVVVRKNVDCVVLQWARVHRTGGHVRLLFTKEARGGV